jgi:hypothetical protein
MTSVCERAAKRKPSSKAEPVKIVNAGCPRIRCNGDVYYDPATKWIFCPDCRARGVAAILTAAAVKGGAL